MSADQGWAFYGVVSAVIDRRYRRTYRSDFEGKALPALRRLQVLL
jgi:hypothetical protein